MKMNKVQLIGRFTADPELRYTPSNKPVSSFSIAVNKRVNGENSADFINCVAWNTTAEFISKYFKKGQGLQADMKAIRKPLLKSAEIL